MVIPVYLKSQGFLQPIGNLGNIPKLEMLIVKIVKTLTWKFSVMPIDLVSNVGDILQLNQKSRSPKLLNWKIASDISVQNMANDSITLSVNEWQGQF